MLAKIKLREYKKYFYYIVDFGNFLTKSELPEKYLQCYPHFYQSTWDNRPCIKIFMQEYFKFRLSPTKVNKTKHIILVKDSCFFKSDLPGLVNILRSGGQHLTDIRQKKKEFTITI